MYDSHHFAFWLIQRFMQIDSTSCSLADFFTTRLDSCSFFWFYSLFFFPQMRATVMREDLTNIPRQIQICSQYDFRGTTTAHNDSFNDSISQVRNVQTIYISCLECIIDHKHKTQKLRIKTFNNTLTSRSYTHLKRYVISGNFLFMSRSFIKLE